MSDYEEMERLSLAEVLAYMTPLRDMDYPPPPKTLQLAKARRPVNPYPPPQHRHGPHKPPTPQHPAEVRRSPHRGSVAFYEADRGVSTAEWAQAKLVWHHDPRSGWEAWEKPAIWALRIVTALVSLGFVLLFLLSTRPGW